MDGWMDTDGWKGELMQGWTDVWADKKKKEGWLNQEMTDDKKWGKKDKWEKGTLGRWKEDWLCRCKDRYENG